MARSRLYPYRWDAWIGYDRIHSATAFTMKRAVADAEKFFASCPTPSRLAMKITTPNGVDYILTHPAKKWVLVRSL